MTGTQDYELHAYLGDSYDALSDDQRAALLRAADQIARRWPDPDDADLRGEAMAAATMIVLGDATDEDVGAGYAAARRAEQDARARLTGAIILGRIVAPEPEAQQAARLGVTRMTLRKALGK